MVRSSSYFFIRIYQFITFVFFPQPIKRTKIVSPSKVDGVQKEKKRKEGYIDMYFPSVREYRKIDGIYLSGIVGNVLYIYYNVYTSFGENLGEKCIYHQA